MKHFIWLFAIIICCQPTQIHAQSSENFDEITVNSSGNSLGTTNPRIFGTWSMGILDQTGAYGDPSQNYLDVTNRTLAQGGTNMANGTDDKALSVSGAYLVGKTFIMKSTAPAGQHFALSSFTIDDGDSTWLAEGYLGGTRVVSQQFTTTKLTPQQINLTDPKWQNIDEFRIELKSGAADIIFYLDDITVATALPVTLTTFRGESLPTGTLLNWQLGIKDGIAAFEVQRSQNGTDFTDLASVALSASTDQLHYSYLDQQATPGINYYRLKMVKASSNTVDYSQIIQVNNTNVNAAGWQIYPNPVASQLSLTAPDNIHRPITLDIINASGQQLRSIILSTGKHHWQLDLPELASGIYLLSIRQGHQLITTLKMMKQ